VVVSRPIRREAAPWAFYSGRLVPLRAVEVRPAVSGFVQAAHFKAGAEVKKGDLLFELDSRACQLAVHKALADLAVAEAKKIHTASALERASRLKATGGISREEYDQIAGQAASAEAALKTAQVDVERAKLDLESTKVRAPMTGRVGRPLVEPGTLVFRGPDRATLLTTVTALDPIGVTFDMDERTFLLYQRHLREHKVKGVGSRLRIATTDQEGLPLEATLEGFDSHLDPKLGTVGVRASLANPNQLLLPGMFVRVHMTLGPPRPVLEVPEEAILTIGPEKFVLVVNDRNVVERRPVTLGRDDNGQRIIEKGLHLDDWVVITGLTGIRPGDQVEPRKRASPKKPDAQPDGND
jgi:RND family efflux transporter MFP subunit